MSKCSYCEQELDYLVCSYNINRQDELRYDKDSNSIRVTRKDTEICGFSIYRCPLCGEMLFYTLDSVEKFLKE